MTLTAVGLARCARYVAYPDGVCNADTLTAMAAIGMRLG